ncbi:MAG: ABC transporter ATP-binding protein [Mogibacterium sp.]|nr:ABC transporter ATP-binding protein [Mogibacterium sp.]
MRQEQNTILESRELSAGYGAKTVLQGVSFTVRPGEILVLIGPNGAGKSTLLKTLAGQLKELAGTVYLDGQEQNLYTSREIAEKRSVMLTERMTSEQMTCYEAVSLGRYPYTGRLGILSEEDHRVVRESMERVRCLELADRDIHAVSDGQLQRVLLARAIAQEPEILILDEPTSYLDVRFKLEFLDLLRDLARTRGIGIVVSLHELEFAHLAADRVLCIAEDGSIGPVGTPEEVFTEKNLSELYNVPEGRLQALYGSFLRSMKG